MDNLKTRDSLNKNAYIMLITAVITKIIGALFKIPLASDACLGDLGFGYFSSAYDFLTPISVLALSGFPVAISRIIADNIAKGDEEKAIRYFAVSKKVLSLLAVFGFIGLVILIFPFVRFTDETGQSIYSMLAVAPCFVLCCILSVYRGYFEGLSNMKPIAVSNLLEALGKLIIGYSLATITVKLTNNCALASAAALFGITISTAVSTLYIYLKYRKDYNFKRFNVKEKTAVDIKTVKLLFTVILPIAISSLAGSIVSLIDSLTVRAIISENLNTAPNVYEAMFSDLISESGIGLSSLSTVLYGIRGKAFTLFNLVPALAIAIAVGIVPSVTAANAKGDTAVLNRGLQSVFKLIAVISFPVGIGFIFLNTDIMNLLYGKGAASNIGGKMLAIFGFALILAAFTVVQSGVLQAIGKQNAVFRNVIAGLALKLVLNICLTANAQFNIYGCVYSTLACYLLIFIFNAVSLAKRFNIFVLIRSAYKPFFSAIFGCSVAVFVSKILDFGLGTFVAIVVAAILYFVFLLILKVFSAEELGEIPLLNKLFIAKNKEK